METKNLNDRLVGLLTDLEIIERPDQVTGFKSLSGGIASDVLVVDTAKGQFCVKFALPKLRVKVDWFAPIHRSKSEYEWLRVAERAIPENTPQMYGFSDAYGGFAMEYVGGDSCYMWKQRLLKELPDPSIARQVAESLGRIQAIASRDDFDAGKFDTKDVFFHMRIDPYINYTGLRHPDLQHHFLDAAKVLADASATLVHGDVSPKNVMVKENRAILIDAECASMGDPAFDVAFCLNHFFLKAIFSPLNKLPFLETASVFLQTYLAFVEWESPQALDERVATYLPLLALARVDGKSPVEYLDSAQQEQVRTIAIPSIRTSQNSSKHLLEDMFEGIAEVGSFG